jgi:hypothetical protein
MHQPEAAGRYGRTEVPLPRNRRLDALTKGGNLATEVERSGNINNLEMAARRLRDSGASKKVFQVPQMDMPAAAAAMRKVGVSGTIKNLGGTKSQSVRPSKK